MNIFEALGCEFISKRQAEQGGAFVASRDIHTSCTDRKDGYTEICVALAGDLLEIIGMCTDGTDRVKVRSHETDEMSDVDLNDLEEM